MSTEHIDGVDRIDGVARILHGAVGDVAPVEQFSGGPSALTLDEAYAVQARGIALRVGAGEQVVGVKLGFTSRAKAEQMGVDDVILGRLTDAMQVADGSPLRHDLLLHPRVEPEIAFRLAVPLGEGERAPDPATAVAAVAPALEIIDSRYRDFRFSLEDVVADNTSAARFVVGTWRTLADALRDGDLTRREVSLSCDGSVVAEGTTADILGDPMLAVEAAHRLARRHGVVVPAGSVLLAGAATAAVPLPSSALVAATVAGLGSVSVTTTPGGGDRA